MKVDTKTALSLFDAEAPALTKYFIATNIAGGATPKKAAEMVDLVIKTIRLGIESGELKPLIIGGRVALDDEQLISFAKRKKRGDA